MASAASTDERTALSVVVGDSEEVNLTSATPPQQIEDLIREYFPECPDVAIAVARAESGLNPDVIGDRHLAKPSIGLFQINQIWHNYSTEELQNPEFNIKIAKQIFNSGGWNRWTTYKTGRYKLFIP